MREKAERPHPFMPPTPPAPSAASMFLWCLSRRQFVFLLFDIFVMCWCGRYVGGFCKVRRVRLRTNGRCVIDLTLKNEQLTLRAAAFSRLSRSHPYHTWIGTCYIRASIMDVNKKSLFEYIIVWCLNTMNFSLA